MPGISWYGGGCRGRTCTWPPRAGLRERSACTARNWGAVPVPSESVPSISELQFRKTNLSERNPNTVHRTDSDDGTKAQMCLANMVLGQFFGLRHLQQHSGFDWSDEQIRTVLILIHWTHWPNTVHQLASVASKWGAVSAPSEFGSFYLWASITSRTLSQPTVPQRQDSTESICMALWQLIYWQKSLIGTFRISDFIDLLWLLHKNEC